MNEWKWKGIIYYLLGLNNSLRHITPFIPKVCCWVELLNETKLKLYSSTYIISLGGRPFHPSVPSSIHPTSSSWKKKMTKEKEEDESGSSKLKISN
jgi:hypothetical protein